MVKTKLAIAVMTGALMAAPALAQQNQGQGSNIGSMLEDLGRSLNGQGNAPANPQQDYQQTYDRSAQQYRSASNQQLQQDEQRLNDARARLDAASHALDQEMSRRGMQVGSNQNRYNGPNNGNYSGSSTAPGYGSERNGGYTAPNGGYSSGGNYNGPNGNYGQGGNDNRNDTGPNSPYSGFQLPTSSRVG